MEKHLIYASLALALLVIALAILMIIKPGTVFVIHFYCIYPLHYGTFVLFWIALIEGKRKLAACVAFLWLTTVLELFIASVQIWKGYP